jgi:Ca-activated chloride channel family protein
VSPGRGAVAALLGLLAGAQPGFGQEDQPPRSLSFGSETEVVRLDVSVVDRADRFVTDLKGGDFVVREDGRPQSLTMFLQRELPVSLTLLLDASSSIANRLSLAKAAAAGFLDDLQAQDEASVVEFGDAVRVLQEPTSDRDALLRAVGTIAAGGGTALYNALYVTLRRLPRASDAAFLRRRAVVLLSDGADTASLVWEEQVVELARRREATIHVIDLRGRGENQNHSARLLRTLAHESGGQVYEPASIGDLDAVYARIWEDLRSQYTLGYVSSNPARDGRWRQIEVKVQGRAGVKTRHRTGYYDMP